MDQEGAGLWEAFAWAACGELRGFQHVYVSPAIPQRVALAALRSYLYLQPDELLLAIVDHSGGLRPHEGFALTTRRLYWSVAPERVAAVFKSRSSTPSRSVTYENISAPLGVTDQLSPGLEVVPGHVVPLKWEGPELRAALVRFLQTVGSAARGDAHVPYISASDLPAGSSLSDVARVTLKCRALQEEMRSFVRAMLTTTPRLVATPLFTLLCVIVYVAMVVRGISPIDPDTASVLAWGAKFGPYIAIDHQQWRLVTCMFLHGGILHLACNMWCLLSVGPLVERLFGNLAFAAIYMFAGIGGSIASLWFHPLDPGVGASGAIFGVVGALLGFLLVHRRAIPPSVLRSLRTSAVGFVVLNVILGAAIPVIDMAAHIGGLATGFVCGLMLQPRWPTVPSIASALRRCALAAVIACSLILTGMCAVRHVARDPEVIGQSLASERAAEALNRFIEKVSPMLTGYDATNASIDHLLTEMRGSELAVPVVLNRLDRFSKRAEDDRAKLRQVKVADPELGNMLESITRAQEHQCEALRVLRRYVESPDEQLITGPDGLKSQLASASKNAELFLKKRQAFLKSRGLRARRR